MKMSGNREKFATGAIRDMASDKPRPDEISPFAILREATRMKEGAAAYGEGNWRKGMSFTRTIASLERHLLAVKLGMKDEDHLAAIRCNAAFLMHWEEMIKRGLLPKELNDLPNYKPKNGRNNNV
jgi:hypothetical protein